MIDRRLHSVAHSGRSRSSEFRLGSKLRRVGFCLSVLLRLIAGPVTNHDSSARERRGHTTLGSVSGACCRRPSLLPLQPYPLAPCGSQATLPRNYCALQQRPWRGIEGLLPYLVPDTSSSSPVRFCYSSVSFFSCRHPIPPGLYRSLLSASFPAS